MTTKITIHRGLAELKLLDSRIQKSINEIYPTAVCQKGKKIDGHITEEEFKKNAETSYQSITDLITRKVKLKSAIVKSNAATVVTIGGRQMSVADAITYKTIIDHQKNFNSFLRQRHTGAVANLNKNNDNVNKNVEILLQNAFGKDSTKISKDDLEAVSKPYLDNNTFHLIDPLKAADKITQLDKEIAEFETEVDAVLSESNSVTFIEA